MSGGSKIRAVGSDDALQAQDVAVAEDSGEWATSADHDAGDWVEDHAPNRSWRWIIPVVAGSAVAGWTGFFSWAHWPDITAGGDPRQWTGWVVAWAVPTLLIVAIWLLAMRTSRREARRYGEIADMLSGESIRLERRLSIINRELSLAREFLAAQSRELESVGRIACERISTHADRLQTLIRDNGAQVDAIATVSVAARENMERLRDDLPVVANSARDVSNQIGNAGRTAQGQIAELIGGFERLNQFGEASERQVGALQSRVDAALAAFETQLAQVNDLLGARFDTLREQSERLRTELDGREVEALAGFRRRADTLAYELSGAAHQLDEQEEEILRSMRARLVALRDEAKLISTSLRESEEEAAEGWRNQIDALRTRLMEAIDELKRIDQSALESANRKLEALRAEAEKVDRSMIDRDAKLFAKIAERQNELSRNESEALSRLEERLAALDVTLDERRGAILQSTELLGQRGEAVAARLSELATEISGIAEQGEATEQRLASSIAVLAAQLAESRASIDGTDLAVSKLTDASVRLLELLQASALQTRIDLPAALDDAENRLTALGAATNDLTLAIAAAGRKGEELSNYVIATRDQSEETGEQVDALRSRIERSSAASLRIINDLRGALAAAAEDSTSLSAKAQGELRTAIEALEITARHAVEAIENDSGTAVKRLASRVAEETSEALATALQTQTAASVAEFEQATARAASASRDTTIQLRDQLARVNELAGHLETRVARAREQAEEQIGNDFSRRVALITESLNSSAIDIDKALSADVGDTQWAAYLRGDRGIFTRRAVRLLDNTEAREIAELYDADASFRDNVSRYIADFENMLRTLLSTRDGKALGVTLLSSDMGKLYVALAQAIERLRD